MQQYRGNIENLIRMKACFSLDFDLKSNSFHLSLLPSGRDFNFPCISYKPGEMRKFCNLTISPSNQENIPNPNK